MSVASPNQRNWLMRGASGKTVLIALGVTLIAFVMSHLIDTPGSLRHLMAATGGQPILDLKPSFSADEVYERLTHFGEAGRLLYRQMILTMDFVFPVCLFIFVLMLARYANGRTMPRPTLRWILLAAPFGFFIPDVIENASVFKILTDFPQRHDALANNLGYLTVLKRASIYVALALPLVLLAVDLWRRRARPTLSP